MLRARATLIQTQLTKVLATACTHAKARAIKACRWRATRHRFSAFWLRSNLSCGDCCRLKGEERRRRSCKEEPAAEEQCVELLENRPVVLVSSGAVGWPWSCSRPWSLVPLACLSFLWLAVWFPFGVSCCPWSSSCSCSLARFFLYIFGARVCWRGPSCVFFGVFVWTFLELVHPKLGPTLVRLFTFKLVWDNAHLRAQESGALYHTRHGPYTGPNPGGDPR